MLHVPPSPPRVHLALPLPVVGPGHTFMQEPQWAGVLFATHAPLQFRGVPPSGLHPRPHAPLVHVACPSPESGPSHTLVHVPQCSGDVGSTQVPLQLSESGG
jgi:hypothetical protein